MSECWQDTTPTPTGVPIFKDGKLLFCGGKLATTCCPTGYWYECGNDPWNPVSWESHGQEFHDPPCTAPTEWGGAWEIGATCFGGVCEGAERPLADIYVHGGNACDFSVAVLTEWGCKSVKIDLPSAPFSGTGTWTVWVEGVTMTMDVEVVEGQPFQYTMDLPEGQQNVFADEGRVEFRSRLTMKWPDDVDRDSDNTTYVYSYDWTGFRVTGKPAIYPTMTTNALHLIATDDGRYTLNFTKLYGKGPYATIDRASEVFGGYQDEIEAYCANCACDSDCRISTYVNICYPVLLDPNATSGPCVWECQSGGTWYFGCGDNSVHYSFSWSSGGNGCRVIPQKYIPNIGWVPIGDENGTASGTLGPCEYIRFGGYYDPDAECSGNPGASGDVWTDNYNSSCTSAILAAFDENVPAY
jgi:hypothetical protein